MVHDKERSNRNNIEHGTELTLTQKWYQLNGIIIFTLNHAREKNEKKTQFLY